MQSEPTPEQVEARLRKVSTFGDTHLDGLWSDAADTIASLRAALAERDAEVERLKLVVALQADETMSLENEITLMREGEPDDTP